jgi:ketosteroid isomerase-like protein
MEGAMTDRDTLLAGNAAFYSAFQRGDYEAMASLWALENSISCVHPGWPALIGRDAVMGSWHAILGGGANGPISFHDCNAILTGREGRVLCIESIGGHLLQATNIFHQILGSWKLVHHQSSPIAVEEEQETPPSAVVN